MKNKDFTQGKGPDNLGPFYPDWVDELKDEDVRPEIIELGTRITDRAKIKLGLQKVTKYDPEYWAISKMVPTKELADFALAVFSKIRQPKVFSEVVAAANGKFGDEEHIKKLLEDLSYTGVIEWNYENDKHERQWVLPMYVPGSAEFSNMNKDFIDANPEMGRFFERMSRLPLEGLTHMVPPGGAGIGMHVIPVEKAISMENESASVEHISHWLDKYEGKYASSPCSCRRSREKYGEGCSDDPEGWCIGVGDMADYLVETNKGGRYVTREEVMEILQKAEDNGFVHQITNIDGENKIFAICNCNVNVCYALRTSQLFNTPNMSRSAYVAHVTAEDCVACGKCVEVCPAGAAKLGQKLCKADGSQVQYPKHVLPTEKKWTEDDWDDNYRDNNMINCYETGTAPCKTACPAHIAIQGYLRMAAQGRYKEALALIKQDNPLPAICGRVCNRRCEDACTRGTIDEAIAIDEVKRFIAEMDLKAETRYVPKVITPTLRGGFDQKIAIIGGGPAGISAAFYLAQKGYKPTIFEKNEYCGGMLRYGIPTFVLEKDVIEAEVDVLRQMGVEIKCGVNVGEDVSLDELRAQGYKAFYVAIGCSAGNLPRIENDQAAGTSTAVDFLHHCNAHESYDIKGDVVVIGGGNVAIDVARCARRCGDEKVSMFCLETRDIMPASKEEIEIVEAEGVELNPGWGPKEVLVDENGAVKGIVLKRCTRVKDETGRFAPEYDENDLMTVECKHVVFSVGQRTEYGKLFEGSKVVIERGPKCDPVTYQTDEPDIFVGGDMQTGPRFAIDAIAAGKKAAVSLHRFVQGGHMTIGRDLREFIELDKDDLKIDDYDHSPRQIPGVAKTTVDGDLSWRDKTVEFTEAQIKTETARCLKCGASVVDENKCIGCGLCTTKCEFDAIHLYRDNPECSKMTPSEDKLKYVLGNGFKQALKLTFKGSKK